MTELNIRPIWLTGLARTCKPVQGLIRRPPRPWSYGPPCGMLAGSNRYVAAPCPERWAVALVTLLMVCQSPPLDVEHIVRETLERRGWPATSVLVIDRGLLQGISRTAQRSFRRPSGPAMQMPFAGPHSTPSSADLLRRPWRSRPMQRRQRENATRAWVSPSLERSQSTLPDIPLPWQSKRPTTRFHC